MIKIDYMGDAPIEKVFVRSGNVAGIGVRRHETNKAMVTVKSRVTEYDDCLGGIWLKAEDLVEFGKACKLLGEQLLAETDGQTQA